MEIIGSTILHCKKYLAKGETLKKRVKSYSKWSEFLFKVSQLYNN